METEATTVRAGTTIDGDLRGDEDLVVAGRVHGSIDVSGRVLVSGTGIVRGDVRARTVEVEGLVVGSIDAADRVQVAAGARVVGEVRAPVIDVDDDGVLDDRRAPSAGRGPVLSRELDETPSRPAPRRPPLPSLPVLGRAAGRRRVSA